MSVKFNMKKFGNHWFSLHTQVQLMEPVMEHLDDYYNFVLKIFQNIEAKKIKPGSSGSWGAQCQTLETLSLIVLINNLKY